MRKVYIVVGSTGEYSDHREWFVAAYLDEASAANRVKQCTEFANETTKVSRERGIYYYADEFKALVKDSIDPQIMIDYTGTNYNIATVDLVDEVG